MRIQTDTARITTSAEVSDRTRASAKQEFFQLLVTQLKYQDPSNPIEDREFLTQLAQFSMLEELQEVNRSQALLMLDRAVAYRDPASGDVKAGLVTSVRMYGGEYQLMVDEVPLRMSDVIEVW